MLVFSEHPVLGGTDGFRGVATNESGPVLMNAETVAGLTGALIDYQHEAGIDGLVVVAQDTRPSGDALRRAALAAVADRQVESLDAGVLPTPGAQKIAQNVGALATVVITASHNPWTDNGWKGMLGNRKLSAKQNAEISRLYCQQVESGLTIPLDLSDKTPNEERDWREWYTSEVVSDITNEFGDSPLDKRLFVIDGAFGASKAITPEVFRRLGARVREFSCDDGLINEGCGAAHLEGLKFFLKIHPEITDDPDFIGALANDGDADRVMGVGKDKHGNLVNIDGNHFMEILAMNPPQPGIVGTIYTNSGMVGRLKEKNVDFEYCQNGDSHVTSLLLDKQANGESWRRGGEFTGHLIDTDWLDSGDGVRTAAWSAAYAAKANKTFGNIYDEMPLWPEVMQKISLPERISISIDELGVVQTAITKVRASGGRPVVRASGTEPLVRIWCEAPSDEIANHSARMLRNSVVQALERSE